MYEAGTNTNSKAVLLLRRTPYGGMIPPSSTAYNRWDAVSIRVQPPVALRIDEACSAHRRRTSDQTRGEKPLPIEKAFGPG